MSSQSSITSSGIGRRSAAAFAASAVLSLALAGPALAARPDDPSPQPGATASSECRFTGGAIALCRDANLLPNKAGPGSSSSAEGGTAVPAAPASPKIKVPLAQPTNLPVLGVGIATAALVSGGVALVAAGRRRPVRPV